MNCNFNNLFLFFWGYNDKKHLSLIKFNLSLGVVPLFYWRCNLRCGVRVFRIFLSVILLSAKQSDEG
jgi:hypothetical protein